MQIEKARGNGASTNTESSVLFSLASLSSTAVQPTPASPRPAARPTEDLFGIAALPSPVLAPVVTAPVVIAAAAPRDGGMRGWVAAACVVGAAILGGSYVAATSLAMGRERAPVTVSASPSASETESVGESESAGERVGVGVGERERESTGERERESESATVTVAARPALRRPTTTAHPVVVAPVVPRPEARPPSHPPTLTELVERATRTPTDPAIAPALTAPAHAEPAAPLTPSRDDVTSAMRGVTPAVTACGAQQHGTALVRITVDHTGRVSSALVSGDLAGTPAGSCVAQAVRAASFPTFRQSTFVISYPFRI